MFTDCNKYFIKTFRKRRCSYVSLVAKDVQFKKDSIRKKNFITICILVVKGEQGDDAWIS